jgi:hypothetical protein
MLILTLAIGKDYCKALSKALDSKRKYAEKQGYTYIQGGEEFWNRDRPIAWSKVPFLLHHLNKLPDGEFIWLSDGDVYITNHNIRIEDHIMPLLKDKDLLITHDACGHINSGNLLMRNSPWLRDYWKRVWEEEDCIYHIWWENAAMIKLMQRNANDREHIEVTKEHKKFNAFIMGLPGEPLWEPGDFLVHFAGIYDPKKIFDCIEEIDSGKVPRKDMYAP